MDRRRDRWRIVLGVVPAAGGCGGGGSGIRSDGLVLACENFGGRFDDPFPAWALLLL